MICACLVLATINASANSGNGDSRVLTLNNKVGARDGLLVKGNRNDVSRNFVFVVAAEGLYSISGSDCLKQNGLKYSIGAEYVFPIGKIGGVGLGAHYGMCDLNLECQEFFYSYNTYDDENENFEYRAYGRDLKEKQTIHVIEIPVYCHLGFKNLSFNIGPEIAVPISAKSKTNSGDVELTGYYPKYNVELTDLPNHGFGKYDVIGKQCVLDTKITWGINACFGYSFPLKAFDLNLGVGVKYMFGGYIETTKNYMCFPGDIKSLSYIGEETGFLSCGISLGIGL